MKKYTEHTVQKCKVYATVSGWAVLSQVFVCEECREDEHSTTTMANRGVQQKYSLLSIIQHHNLHAAAGVSLLSPDRGTDE